MDETLVLTALSLGLFLSLWIMLLADIVRRLVFRCQATEKSLICILSRFKVDRLAFKDYYLSLSFVTSDQAAVHCPNYIVRKGIYKHAIDGMTIYYNPHEPRQCRLRCELGYERRMDYMLLAVAVMSTVPLYAWGQLFCKILVTTNETNAALFFFGSMVLLGFYGSIRILRWKPLCLWCGVRDPYYQGATLVDLDSIYDSIKSSPKYLLEEVSLSKTDV